MKVVAALLPSIRKPFQLEEIDLDEPRQDEILVRIVGSGLCHTDIFFRDHMQLPSPAVLGHEGSGVVEKVGGAVRGIVPGDHVVLSYNSCGLCIKCLIGRPYYCRRFAKFNMSGVRPDGSPTMKKDRKQLFGAFFGQSSFANYALASQRNVVKAPKEVPLEMLGPLGGGVQTGAGAVLNALQIPAGSSLVVFGTGSIGLSSVMAAVVAGCTTIIGVDVKPKRLELAQQLGATHVINAKQKKPAEEIRAIVKDGVDFSIETTGVPSVYRQAIEAFDSLGVCGLVGAPPPGTEVNLEMGAILRGLSTRGIIEGESVPQIFIPPMIELYKQGRFPFDKIIQFYDLKSINQAIEDSENGNTVKAVLKPEN